MAATSALFGSLPDHVQRQAMNWLAGLVDAARQRPGGKLDIQDQSGVVVATVYAHQVAKRPKDMPRALRPKHKLSKRQRDAVKRSKLAADPIEERPR